MSNELQEALASFITMCERGVQKAGAEVPFYVEQLVMYAVAEKIASVVCEFFVLLILCSVAIILTRRIRSFYERDYFPELDEVFLSIGVLVSWVLTFIFLLVFVCDFSDMIKVLIGSKTAPWVIALDYSKGMIKGTGR